MEDSAVNESDPIEKDREARNRALLADIQVGLDGIERGEVAPLDIPAIKREARERWETVGRARWPDAPRRAE